jgi:hypothetical protein
VPAADTTIGAITVTPAAGWNQVPRPYAPFARKGAQVWTHDGVLLDRLIIIPGVAEGETLFIPSPAQKKGASLPVFKAGMLPNELVQFTESSLVKLLGEGSTVVTTSNLRPGKLGDQRAILFDLEGTPADGPAYRGLAASVVKDQQLNMILFIAADPHYFAKHKAAVEALIASARL